MQGRIGKESIVIYNFSHWTLTQSLLAINFPLYTCMNNHPPFTQHDINGPFSNGRSVATAGGHQRSNMRLSALLAATRMSSGTLITYFISTRASRISSSVVYFISRQIIVPDTGINVL